MRKIGFQSGCKTDSGQRYRYQLAVAAASFPLEIALADHEPDHELSESA